MADTDAWYRTGLAAYNRRTNNCAGILNFFDKKTKELKLDERRRILSVGPANGNVDVPLLTSHCPRLTHYIGVEPDQHEATALQDRLDSELIDRNVKIEIVAVKAESWSGPGEPVDLILLSHVLYYIPDREAFCRRCREWLAPGGVMVIIHGAGNSIFGHVAERFYVKSPYSFASDSVFHDLMNLGLQNLKQESFFLDLDIRDRNTDILKFMLQKDANEEEISALDTFLREVLPSGVAPLEDMAIWWTQGC